MAPTANVTIAIANRGQTGDDASLTVSPSTLSFTTANWNVPQTVRVSAAQDSDTSDGSAVFTHTASSSDTSFHSAVRNLTLSEEDDDAVGVVVSATAVSVAEGGTATYTLTLDALPTHDVTVNIAKSSGDADITITPTSLVFPVAGWDLPRVVTLSAAEDKDTTAGSATFTHTATSADASYNGVTITDVTVTEVDNDLGVRLSREAISVPEGGSADYTMVLTAVPTSDVTISLGSVTGGDSDLSVDTDLTSSGNQTSLTFTTSNWNVAQTVRVSAAEDSDEENGAKVVTHTVTSTDARYAGITVPRVTATEVDNDAKAVVLSKPSLTVVEGATATWTVKLSTAPSADVTVAVANRGGADDDSDLTVSPASLTFTTTNYSTAQTVTVTAAEDGDKTDGIALFTHTASGGGYDGVKASLTATEDDNDSTNASPTSADFSLAVNRDTRSSVLLSRFPFTDPDATDTLGRIKVVTLPNAATGTLGTVLTGVKAAAISGCVGDIQPIAVGQEIVNSLGKVLYFCPKSGFSNASFQFRVFDSQGQVSANTYTATLVGPPGQVTGVSTTAGNGYVSLFWQDPRNTTVTGYEYRYKAGAGSYGAWTTMTGSDATTTRYSVANLTNSVVHTFQVRARSVAGPSPVVSAEVSATPTTTIKPVKPTGFVGLVDSDPCTVNRTNYICVHLFWDNPQDPSITRYELERQHPILPGEWLKGSIGWTDKRMPDSNASTVSTRVAAGGEHDSKPYKFRLRAVNAAGEGAWSSEVSLLVDTNLARPLLLPATAGNGRVQLRWRYFGWHSPSCKAGSASCWKLNVTDAGIGDLDHNARTYTVTGLTNGQTYSYKLRPYIAHADNSHQEGEESNQISISLPTAPAKPTGLTIQPSTTGVVLSWTNPNNDSLSGYQYRQKVGDGSYSSWTRLPGSNGDTTSYAISGLISGTTYAFELRGVIEYSAALGGDLVGTASDEVSATPFGVVASSDAVAVPEGGTATYTLKLSKQPTTSVVVTATLTGDTSLTLDTDSLAAGNQNTLTFTNSNWSTAQTVTLAAAEDGDELHGQATIEHSVASSDSNYTNVLQPPTVTATETDNDVSLVLSSSSLSVPEGGSADYTLALSRQPVGNVTVTITRTGDTDLTVDTDANTAGNQNNVVFSPSSWSARTVTITAAEDIDGANGTATFTHTLSGGSYSTATAQLVAVEADNDRGLNVTAITGSSATLELTGHTTAWYYNSNQPAATCTAVAAGTTTVNLTSLGSGVSYTYTAYSDSTCNTSLGSMTFSTVTLTASAVAANAATLTIANHSGD